MYDIVQGTKSLYFHPRRYRFRFSNCLRRWPLQIFVRPNSDRVNAVPVHPRSTTLPLFNRERKRPCPSPAALYCAFKGAIEMSFSSSSVADTDQRWAARPRLRPNLRRRENTRYCTRTLRHSRKSKSRTEVPGIDDGYADCSTWWATCRPIVAMTQKGHSNSPWD